MLTAERGPCAGGEPGAAAKVCALCCPSQRPAAAAAAVAAAEPGIPGVGPCAMRLCVVHVPTCGADRLTVVGCAAGRVHVGHAARHAAEHAAGHAWVAGQCTWPGAIKWRQALECVLLGVDRGPARVVLCGHDRAWQVERHEQASTPGLPAWLTWPNQCPIPSAGNCAGTTF